MMRTIGFLFLTLLAACTPALQQQDVSKLHQIIQKIYLSPGNECKAPVICGDTVAVDCGTERDLPLVYFNNRDGEVIMYCGGACDVPENMPPDPKRCTACPPPQWRASCPSP
nr:putative integron gene cassette protein [uncultured bacterium]